MKDDDTNEKLEKLQSQINQWQEKYKRLFDEHNTLKNEHDMTQTER